MWQKCERGSESCGLRPRVSGSGMKSSPPASRRAAGSQPPWLTGTNITPFPASRWAGKGALERLRGSSGWVFFFFFSFLSPSLTAKRKQSVSQSLETNKPKGVFMKRTRTGWWACSGVLVPLSTSRRAARDFSIRPAAPPLWKSVFCSDPGGCYEHRRIRADFAWRHMDFLQGKNGVGKQKKVSAFWTISVHKKRAIQQQPGATSLLSHQLLSLKACETHNSQSKGWVWS